MYRVRVGSPSDPTHTVMARSGPIEADFQEAVIEAAHVYGWKHMHVRRSIGKGRKWTTATNVAWPDLTLWNERQQRFLVAELKSEMGVLSDQQVAVLSSLRAAGVEAYTWRPSSWPAIEMVLRGER